MKEIKLDIAKTNVKLESPLYQIQIPFEQKVNKRSAKAKFSKKTKTVELTIAKEKTN